MTPLELINAHPMPFAVLMGVTFVAADKERWSPPWWCAPISAPLVRFCTVVR